MPTSFVDWVTQFEQFLRVERGLAERTRKAYLYELDRFHEYLILLHGRMPRLSEITADALREYLNHCQLERGYKSATVARVIAPLRSFFGFLTERGEIQTSPAAVLRTPKQPKKLPIYLVKQELTRLLAAPDPETDQGLRDRAILTTLAFTGLRLSELVGINLRDLDLINRTVRVMGKGRKERLTPMNEVVCEAINRYLDVRMVCESEALFLNRFQRRLSGRSVELIVRKYTLKAGIFKDGISPHKLRHTFATLLHANEIDLIEIQSLMGHASIASTQIYTHTSNARLRSAVEKLNTLDEEG